MRCSLFISWFVAAGLGGPVAAQRLDVTPGRALIDQTIVIQAKGLRPKEQVRIEARLVDGAGRAWQSEANFIADDRGLIDISKQRPVSGSYSEVSPMGMVWSMAPAANDGVRYVQPKNNSAQIVYLSLVQEGKQSATATFEQLWLGTGVQRIVVREDGLRGLLFLPTAPSPSLVLANVPDVTVVPFLTSAEKVAAQAGLPLNVIGPILGIGPGAFVAPDAFPLIPAILANPALGPLPGNLVLDAAEVAIVRATVDQYNSFIALQAQMHGGALVDIHALTDLLRAHGFVVHGQRLTTDFLGGLFSLDGTHPSNTGYGLFANEFIHVLNTNFAAGIPPANLEKIVEADPLVLIGVGHPPSALGHVSADAAKSLRAVMLH